MGLKPKKRPGEKRDIWSERKTETLVDHYILKKVRKIIAFVSICGQCFFVYLTFVPLSNCVRKKILNLLYRILSQVRLPRQLLRNLKKQHGRI